jgi:hypothetical protein
MARPNTICNTAREIGVAMYLAQTSGHAPRIGPGITIRQRKAEAAEPGHNTAHAAAWAGTARVQRPQDTVLSDRGKHELTGAKHPFV